MFKPGTRIKFEGSPSIGGMPAVSPETATVLRWTRTINGERMDGWHVVRFDSDKAVLIAHESRFEVLS